MQNTQKNSNLVNETVLTKKQSTIMINDHTNRISELKNSRILHESKLHEAEKTILQNPETVRNHYNYKSTEKNTLNSQHNSNLNNIYSTEERRKNRIYNLNTENSIMLNGINCMSPKLNNCHYKSLSINENAKYKENYLNSLENLKDNINSPTRLRKERILALKYDDLPRVDLDSKNQNSRMNLFCNVIQKSIKNYQSDSIDKNLDDLIVEENLKLKNYINNMNKFMDIKSNDKFDKYPNLMELQKMKKLKHQNLVISNNRFMGEKYDPLNYIN